jgi:hypothetical protein
MKEVCHSCVANSAQPQIRDAGGAAALSPQCSGTDDLHCQAAEQAPNLNRLTRLGFCAKYIHQPLGARVHHRCVCAQAAWKRLAVDRHDSTEFISFMQAVFPLDEMCKQCKNLVHTTC